MHTAFVPPVYHLCTVFILPIPGPIPSSISNAKELRHVNLGGNKLDGHIPLLPKSVRLFNVRYVLRGARGAPRPRT